MPIPGCIAIAKGTEHYDQLGLSQMPPPGIMDKVGLEWPRKGNVGAVVRKSEDKCCKRNSCALA